ncbi:LytTR family DNA-binding domain-containing protein [Phenylobacterium sp.]|uniref:LytTR family DNA-binding domain-containing protein n=1 Tax=Phenylobacterium sp. TaxID=1871053 RepID=UPI003D2C8F45
MSDQASAKDWWGRDAVFVATVAMAGCAIAIVGAFSVTHDRAEAGDPIPLWEPLVWETTSVAVMTALAPAIMAYARRLLPFAAPWPQVIAGHLLGAAVFSVLHVTAMGVLRWAIYASVGKLYVPWSPLGDFAYEFRKDLVVYFALVATYVIWRRLASADAPLPVEGVEAAIEVRDGARRRFVCLSEIEWVEAAGNYVELHRCGTPILLRAPLSEMERRLQSAGFVRIHRSRLVRRTSIAEVESKPSGDYVVRLSGGQELAGSRRYRRPLLDP